jgi:hypothetical protein
MALQDFRKEKDKGSTPVPTSSGGVGALTAFIDQGSEFSGKLSFKDTVRIDGRFEGEIKSENTLIVGETGSSPGGSRATSSRAARSSCTRRRTWWATSTPRASPSRRAHS